MPYVYQRTQRGEPRSAAEFPSLTSEVLRETFAQSFEENPVASIYRAVKLRNETLGGSQRLDATTARQRIKDRGLEGELTVNDAGITEDALETLMFRKRVEKRRQEVFSRARGGFLEGAGRLGVGLGTGLVDPLNVATAFIPVIGQERYAALLARQSGLLGRTGVRVGVGAVEGAVGQAVIEPLTYSSRKFEQADYEMADSLLNVAFGGVFGAGLHSFGGAISDGIHVVRGTEPTWRPIKGLTQEETASVRALRTEIAAGMDARDVARAMETFTPEMRRAMTPEPRKLSRAETLHQDLPPKVREDVQRQTIVQAVTDEPIDATPIIRAAQEATQTREAAKVAHEVDEDTGAHTVTTEGGEVHAQESGRYLQVKRADVVPERRGAGLAQAMIDRLMTEAQARGLTLASDVTVSADAQRVYEALDRRGYTVVENPNTVSEATGSKVSNDPRVPVYEVTARPQPVSSPPAAVPDYLPGSRELDTAVKHAEEVIAHETDTGEPTVDTLKMATEEATLAQTDLKALTDRLGMEAEDAELTAVLEAATHSERWAKAAELATVCLIRGG